MAAADLHVAVEDHEDTEAGAIEIFDAGEVEDELVNALIGDSADPGFDFAQRCAEGHASGQTEDGSGEVDGFKHRFESHGAGLSCVAASISQVELRDLAIPDLRADGCLLGAA